MTLRSLRWRLALGTGLVSALFFTCAVAVSYHFIHGFLLDEFDIELRERALLLADQIKADTDAQMPHLHFTPLPTNSGEIEHQEFVQLWDANGNSLGRSPKWVGPDLNPHPRAEVTGTTVTLPGGSQGRQVTVAFDWQDLRQADKPVHTLVLTAAQDNVVLNNILQHIFWTLTLCGFAAALGTMLVATAVIGSLLSPVRQLAFDLEAMDQNDLSTRLDDTDSPRELQPVVQSLNNLLARLKTAFEREKTLTADLAHELRTPLHGLRLTLDVALAKEREAAQYRQTLKECQSMVAATQVMTQNLLTLAKLDTDAALPAREAVPLLPLLQETWQPLAAEASRKQLTLSWPQQDAWALTHGGRLRPALANLLGNAVEHTPNGGQINLTLEPMCNNRLRLTLANSGSQVSAQDSAKVFDRFWRQDAARTDGGTHCGLGLAIVQRTLSLLDIPITVRSQTGGWFEVNLQFEAAASPPQS